jgi:hypothetical protein
MSLATIRLPRDKIPPTHIRQIYKRAIFDLDLMENTADKMPKLTRIMNKTSLSLKSRSKNTRVKIHKNKETKSSGNLIKRSFIKVPRKQKTDQNYVGFVC